MIALVVCGAGAGLETPALGRAAGAPFSISLSDTPSTADPLLITFTATVVPGTPTGFNWSFGDGSFWNGSGAALFNPSHLYPTAGSYNATVRVHEGAASALQWLVVSLVSPNLTVTVRVQNATGPAPLTVTFDATVLGGSGTYRSFVWSFGDGGTGSGLHLSYSYVHPGQFRAVLNVTDSSGTSQLAIVPVNATDGHAVSTNLATSPGMVALWGLAGAAVGVLATLTLTGRLFRRARASESSVTSAGPPPSTSPGPVDDPGRPIPPSSTLPSPPEPVLGPGAIAETPAPRPAVPAEALRLSERVVVHLARLGVLSSDEVAPLGFSQMGMAADLGVPQNRITNVLRRLAAAGILTEELRHVRGRSRRLKVYRLTPRGETLAKELRVRHRTPAGPVPRPGASLPRPAQPSGNPP